MEMAEIRKIFKENELRSYSVFPKERKIVFKFANRHTLSIQIKKGLDVNNEWKESIVVKIGKNLIART